MVNILLLIPQPNYKFNKFITNLINFIVSQFKCIFFCQLYINDHKDSR